MMAKYNVVWKKLGVGYIKSLLLFSLLFCKSILKWKVYLEIIYLHIQETCRHNGMVYSISAETIDTPLQLYTIK